MLYAMIGRVDNEGEGRESTSGEKGWMEFSERCSIDNK